MITEIKALIDEINSGERSKAAALEYLSERIEKAEGRIKELEAKADGKGMFYVDQGIVQKVNEEAKQKSEEIIERAWKDMTSNKPSKSVNETREELGLKPIVMSGPTNKSKKIFERVEGPVGISYRDAADGTMKFADAYDVSLVYK